jgi:hypothetical protein
VSRSRSASNACTVTLIDRLLHRSEIIDRGRQLPCQGALCAQIRFQSEKARLTTDAEKPRIRTNSQRRIRRV